jgi:hypothetical protein
MSLEREYYTEFHYRNARHMLDRLFRVGRFYNRDEIDRDIRLLIDHVNNMTTEPPVRINQPIRALTMLTRYNISPDPIENTEIIDNSVLEEYCPNECVICQEIPKYKDAIRTECNHYYCKTCWESWMNATSTNKNCPTCRKNRPTVSHFKAVEIIPNDESV